MQFNTRLRVEQLDERRWKTMTPLIYESAVAGMAITVPVRFITDFASVPRTPLVWWVAGGIGDAPATIHDWLYQRHEIESHAQPPVPIDKALADAVFREALCSRGISAWRAWTMWQAVRMFGGTPWRTGPERFAALNPIWFAERASLRDIMDA